MRTLSKVMALAVLALVAGNASALSLSQAGSPKQADGTQTITLTLLAAVSGATYDITGPVAVGGPAIGTITADNVAPFDGLTTIAITSATIGVYTITATNQAAPFDSTTVRVTFQRSVLTVTITVSLDA